MDEEELIREAMRVIGRRTSERKSLTSRENGAKARAIIQSEEHKAKLREAQKARREREKEAKIAAGLLPAEPTEKRKPGRPKTKPEADANAPKRPVGRPKKQTSPNTLPDSETPQNGA